MRSAEVWNDVVVWATGTLMGPAGTAIAARILLASSSPSRASCESSDMTLLLSSPAIAWLCCAATLTPICPRIRPARLLSWLTPCVSCMCWKEP